MQIRTQSILKRCAESLNGPRPAKHDASAVIVGVLAASLASIVGGCGSDFQPPAKDNVTLDDIPGFYAKSYCEAAAACSTHYVEVFFGANDCTSLLTKKLEQASLPLIKSAVAAGTMRFDLSKLDACMEKVKALGCKAFDNEYIEVCEELLSGAMPMGEKCAFDEECKGDAYCHYDGTCPGVCTTRELSGQVCRDDKECRAGMKCFGGECTPKVPLGGACAANGVECEGGALCGPDAGTGRTCVALASVFSQPMGAACAIAAGSWCESGAYCAVTAVSLASATQTCVAQAGSGAACNFSAPDMCPADEYCSGTSIAASAGGVTVDGSCKLLPTEGEPCTSRFERGKACAKEHACVVNATGSICRKLKQNGETCADNVECFSDSCVQGLCVPKADCQLK
ncbi:MAG TPA: Dickkopf N-terminal cysteine-rich domain-containing protein [Polyangiaceae bacterium]|nr:Dickkopf N-terminal cysteine-rich domain-containing protein [Polyangiaceae bacterium]